jgi:hypothetical protein
VEDFAGRMTAIGWLAMHHLKGLSTAATNPTTDKAGFDVEVMTFWALINAKVKKDKDYNKEWPEFNAALEDLQSKAQSMHGAEVEAARLEIRLAQLECLVSAAVNTGLLDVAARPMDDRTKARVST